MGNFNDAIRLYFRCPGCGINRTLPRGTQVGDSFDLVPCVKCGTAFRGKLHIVEEVGDDITTPQYAVEELSHE